MLVSLDSSDVKVIRKKKKKGNFSQIHFNFKRKKRKKKKFKDAIGSFSFPKGSLSLISQLLLSFYMHFNKICLQHINNVK